MSSMSNCLSFSFPPFPEGVRESFNGKLLAAEPGVSEGAIVDVEGTVWVMGMSRGAGYGFVDGAEVDDAGAGAGGCKEDEERLLGEGERAERAMAGEPGGWDPLPPIGVVLRPGLSEDAAALRTASYSWAALCVGFGWRDARGTVPWGVESARSSKGPS